MNSWMLLKEEAEKFFKSKDYQKACDHYKETLTDIESKLNESKPDLNVEAAKITSNLSLMYLKLSKEQNDKSLLLESKKYAKKTISFNPKWIKGYLRLKEACKQSNNEEDILNSITAYLQDNKDATLNEDFNSLLKEVDYYKTIMMSSPSWHLVEYKDNVYLVDPLGAGHFKDFEEFINCHGSSLQRISVLVRPGVYENTFDFINVTLDIVGDCNIKMNSKTKAIDKDPTVIFTNAYKMTPEHAPITLFFNNCKVSLKRISVYSEEFRAIACQSADLKLVECSLFTKCSDSLFCYKKSILNCESCRFVGGYGGVLIGSGSHAKLTDCFISEMKGIGIHARDCAEMTYLKHCTVTKCNLQGLLVWNGAKQAKIVDSHFEDNYNTFATETELSSIVFEGCRVLFKRTYVKSENCCGIAITDESGTFDKVVIENCFIGISVRANVKITNCNIDSCKFIAIQILQVVKGGVVLENNNITKCSYEIARLDISPMPTFKGDTKHSVITLSYTDRERAEFFKEKRKSKRESARGMDKGLNEISCAHCGLPVENKLKACGECQMVYYCSSKCQLRAWKFHKYRCEHYLKTKLAAREEIKAIETIQEYTNENNTMSRTNQTEGNDISIDHLDEIGATAEVTEVKSDDRNDVSSNIPEWKRKNKKKKKKVKSKF